MRRGRGEKSPIPKNLKIMKTLKAFLSITPELNLETSYDKYVSLVLQMC